MILVGSKQSATILKFQVCRDNNYYSNMKTYGARNHRPRQRATVSITLSFIQRVQPFIVDLSMLGRRGSVVLR
jgi:hypothetical protein